MPAATRHAAGFSVWVGIALGPLAWALSQQASYVLASLRCGPGGSHAVLVVNAMAALVALLGLALCWHGRRTPAGFQPTGSARAERHFLAGIGMALGGLFTLVIVAQGLAGVFFNACAG